MVVLSKKSNQPGDIICGYLAVSNSQVAVLNQARADDGRLAVYAGSGYIQKIVVTNYSTANRDIQLFDNGPGGSDSILIYKQFLHQIDLTGGGAPGTTGVYTTKAEIIDFPSPGLFFHGNLKAVSNGSSGVVITIIARQT